MTQKRKGLERNNTRGAEDLVTRLSLRHGTLFNHPPRRVRIAVPHAHEVHIEHARHVLVADVERGGDLGDARVGDHDVQGAEGGDRLVDEGFHVGGVGDVGDDADGRVGAVLGVEVGDEGVDAGFVGGDVVDGYGVVFGRETAGDGFSAGRGCEDRKVIREKDGGIGGWGRTYMPRLEPVMIAALLPILV